MREFFWGLFDIWNVIQEMIWPVSIVISLVILCRVFVGKVSKQASYFLWIVVAIRLLVPVMPESGLSIFNIVNQNVVDVNTVIAEDTVISELSQQENTVTDMQNPIVIPETGNGAADGNDNFLQQSQPEENNTNPADTSTPEHTQDTSLFENHLDPDIFWRTNQWFVVWLIGMAVMGCYGITSYCVLKYKLRFATSSDRKVYEVEHISSPFVFGVIKPRIYLPYHLSEAERDYILRHENYHIKRRDYLVKILAFTLLAIYWFHPLVWVAFYLMSRDMELSCDEQVLKELGVEERKTYSTLLLSFASGKHFPLPSPVSFGENDIKSRIKGILNYKKPTFWSLVGMLVLIVVLVAGCLTDAKEETYETTEESAEALAETLFELKSSYIGDAVANGKILGALFEELGIEGFNGMELQTRMEPYWISISFDQQPSNTKMWQISAMFLALVDNANEVRWSYYDEDDDLCTYYVTTGSVNNWMESTNIKDYAASKEKLAELWKMLDEKRIYAAYSSEDNESFLVASTKWDSYAIKADMDFTERIEWENRLTTDGIGYRGDDGLVRHCYYQDFDQNGTKDLIVIIRALNRDDNIDDIFCIYMNDEPVYVHEVPYMGAFWNVTVADIDNDTYLEFLFSGDSGGTGGYGFNAIFELLKHKNGTFESMPLPLDEYCEWEEETAGFGIELYTTDTAGQYRAYCPGIDEEVLFKVHTYNNTEFEPTTPANSLVGKEYCGFHALTPVLQDGKYYLLAKEAVERSDGPYRFNDIAIAEFLLYWDEANGWMVDSFEVIPHGVDGISGDEFALAERLLLLKTDSSLSDTGVSTAILNDLARHYDINLDELGMQINNDAGWITLKFEEQPNDTAMWKMASVFLALHEDIEEFRWEFVGANDTLYTYYVARDDVAKILKRDDIAEYAVSDDHLAGMMMLLDENATGVTKSTNDTAQELNKHLSYSVFNHYTDKAGIPRDVADSYERRLIEDGVIYRNDEYKAIYECIYKDFDHSGEMDMALYIRDLGYGESMLHIYMNNDPLYTHVLPMSCWSMEILSGDIDHDGNTELIYSAYNGGSGGAGGYVKGILKYKNHTFTEMELPGDFTEEERANGEAGYHIEVSYGKELNLYRIVCPSVNDFGVIEAEYLKNEDGTYLVRPNHGELVGANCRGFYNLHIIQEKNKDYLMAEEYFHGEGGVNHALGYIRFIFDWNNAKGWTVKGATVHQYVSTASKDEDVFEAMKHEILYYPDSYKDLAQNWSNIPVVNNSDSSVHDPHEQFTQYAYMTTRNMGTGSLIYAKINEKEELSYVYINYQNDKYYYLEDYSRCSDKPYYIYDEDYFSRVYTGEFHTAEKYTSGDCVEYFYLTNEENLTNQFIYERLLSSQYPADFDMILVYRKQLDEKGLEKYTRCTGDFVAQGIKITMPTNHSWIGNPLYKLDDGVISGTYTDFHIESDMNVLVGTEEAVYEKTRIGLKENLEEWEYETWGATTSDGEWVEIELYLEQLGATNFNTVVAKWEYEGNTYLLYGDTKSTDGSPVAKTAIHIIQNFEKHE